MVQRGLPLKLLTSKKYGLFIHSLTLLARVWRAEGGLGKVNAEKIVDMIRGR
jgi:hypothetical protein